MTRGTDSASPASSSAEPEQDLDPGRVLGKRFRIDKRVGEGGMGAVFRATDLQTGANVAVKTLLPEAAKDAALRKRFEREAQILKKLEHPNFVRFVGYGSGASEPAYVVMEFLDGSALSRVISEESRLLPLRALHITRHVLTGLQYAHELGVVHRDVKPDNVVLVQEDRDPEFAKVLDFGIARMAEPEAAEKTKLTQKGEIFGTPAYMAPEQVRGDPVDPRADLYSVSVMLYEMLASRPPFVAKNQMGLFAMHLATMPPPLQELAPDTEQIVALQALLDIGLAKEPEQRFASAADYLERIDSLILADFGAGKGTQAAARPPPRKPARASTVTTAATKRAPTSPAGHAGFTMRSKLALAAVLAILLLAACWFLFGRGGHAS